MRSVARASAASGREKADEIRLIPLPVGVPRELCFRRGIYEKVRRTKTDVAFAQCCKGLRGERTGKRRM